MTMLRTEAIPASWDGADFTVERVAAALDWTEQAVDEVISSLIPHGASPTPTQKVGLAVVSALHRQAEIALPVATAIVRERWRVCDSIRVTLDFVPPASATGQGASVERDPFNFFAAHAPEALTVPSIDEFLDITDHRRILWRRPDRDAYRMACELHRLTEAIKSEDTPALQEAYLDLLFKLREPAVQISEWIGTIADEVFKPAPDRFAEHFPAMRLVKTYGMCVSVNLSLAARRFKRRMLGLEVKDPIVGRSSARLAKEEAPALG